MSTLTKAQIQQAQQLHDSGTSWASIGRQFGCSATTVHRAVDPDFYRNKTQSYQQRGFASIDGKRRYVETLSQADIRAGRSWMDRPDRRDLTSLMLGDPPTGRSALDQRKARETRT